MGVSPNTIDCYLDRLGQAFRVLNPYATIREDFIAFLYTIPTNARGYATRHVSDRTLKTFYRWLNTNYGVPNPMQNLPAPKLSKPIMPTLKLDQIKQLMSNQSTRNRAIISLATASGVRLSELANVNIEVIDWKTEKIRTVGRGNKEAFAPLLFAVNDLKAWFAEYGKVSDSLFGLKPSSGCIIVAYIGFVNT